MSIHNMMSRSLCSLVVSCLALVACEKEEKDSAGDGSGEGTESASASGADSGASDPTEGSASSLMVTRDVTGDLSQDEAATA